MVVLRLNDTTFEAQAVVENYDSLVWTERFLSPGEFILKSSNVDELQTYLPVGSLISTQATREIMVVETHTIQADDSNEDLTLTVEGRSLYSLLEYRTLNPAKDANTGYQAPHEAIVLFLWNSFLNSFGFDVTKQNYPPIPVDPLLLVSNLDISVTNMPNFDVYDYQKYDVSAGGIVLPFVANIQTTEQIGIRALRPITLESYLSASISASHLNQKVWAVYKTEKVALQKKLRFDVYKGVDRSLQQNEVSPVILNYGVGDLTNPSYLKTLKNNPNYTHVIYELLLQYPLDPDELPEVEDFKYSSTVPPYFETDLDQVGFNRRVLYLDVGLVKFSNTWSAEIKKRVNEFLTKNPHTLANGDVSESSRYIYGTHFELGDIVTLTGLYEIDIDVRVSEVIRTEDESGEKLAVGFVLE